MQRARLEHAPDGALGHVPAWRVARIRELAEQGAASVSLRGPTAPGLLDDLDPARVGRVSLPWVPEWREVESLVNWTVIPPDGRVGTGAAPRARPRRRPGRPVGRRRRRLPAGRGGPGRGVARAADAAAPARPRADRPRTRRGPPPRATGRLGEVALVDAGSRVAGLGRTFGVTLLDENVAGHVALGFGFPELVAGPDRARVNASEHHLDVMVGSDQVDATGLTADGRELPLLRGGRWWDG